MKITCQTDYHFLFKKGKISFKSVKPLKKRGNKFKKWKFTFQTDFCVFKKEKSVQKLKKHKIEGN